MVIRFLLPLVGQEKLCRDFKKLFIFNDYAGVKNSLMGASPHFSACVGVRSCRRQCLGAINRAPTNLPDCIASDICNDTLYGGAGEHGEDIFGLGGDDILIGGDGDGYLNGDGLTNVATNFEYAHPSVHGDDTVDGDDIVYGSNASDLLQGGGGSDVIVNRSSFPLSDHILHLPIFCKSLILKSGTGADSQNPFMNAAISRCVR